MNRFALAFALSFAVCCGEEPARALTPPLTSIDCSLAAAGLGLRDPAFLRLLAASCPLVCGDGVLKTPEACDDGGTSNGDGCSSSCTIETGFTCQGAPSVCSGAATVFDFNPGAGSGVTNLTNTPSWGAMTTVILCDARTAGSSNFPCTTGGTFTEEDSSVDNGFSAPFTETGMRSNDYDRFYSHRAPNTTAGEIDTEDVDVITIGYVYDRAATQYLVGKYATGGSLGYAIRITSGGVVQGVANATTFGSYQLDTLGEWNIYELMCDHGATDGARLYVNGYLAGSADDCPSASMQATSSHFNIGDLSDSTNGNGIDGKVAYTRVQKCTACMTSTAAMDALAQENAQRIMGVWPAVAAGTDAPLSTDLRATRASIDITRDDDLVRRLYRVGPYWLRTSRRHEDAQGGRFIAGYLAEPQSTNLLLQNASYTTTWTKLTVGDTVTVGGYPTPFVGKETPSASNGYFGAKIAAALDIVGLEHGVSQDVTLTADTYVVSNFFIYDEGVPTARYGWIRDTDLTDGIAFFDLFACRVALMGAGLNYETEGPAAAARVQDWGEVVGQRTCRAEIAIEGTVATHTLDFGFTDTIGVTTMTTTAAQDLGGMALAQAEQIVPGYIATSPIMTLVSPVQRDLDGLRFAADNIPSSGTLAWEVLFPASGMSNGSTGNVASYECTPYKDANNYILLKSTASTGLGLRAGVQGSGGGVFVSILNAGVAQIDCCSNTPSGQWYNPGLTASNMHDGIHHHARLVFLANDARAYFDGDQTSGVTDTSVSLPSLTGGHLDIGYESVTGTNQSGGLVQRCRFFDREYEPVFP